MARSSYDSSVFINCPFDDEFQPLLRAMVFTIVDCGFRPRCALEISDSAQIRIDKIYELIESCRLAVHDLSRVELDQATGLPRFNMPLELGIFLGAKRFGSTKQKRKSCLILERTPHSYDAFCSDISGQDIKAHGGSEQRVVSAVRHWLRNDASERVILPGHDRIMRRLSRFLEELPQVCASHGLESDNLVFRDFFALTAGWIEANPLSE